MAATLRDAADLLLAAVGNSISATEFTPADEGAVRLALEYARIIDLACDNPDVLKELGPKLLACLESLGLTPAGRAKLKGPASSGKPGGIAQLRAARK